MELRDCLKPGVRGIKRHLDSDASCYLNEDVYLFIVMVKTGKLFSYQEAQSLLISILTDSLNTDYESIVSL